jgi:hypothetical protein
MASAGRWCVRGSAVGGVDRGAQCKVVGASSSGSWPTVGRRAAMAGRGGKAERERRAEEEGGAGPGRLLGRARATRVSAGVGNCAWLGHLLGRAGGEGVEKRPERQCLFFFFKNVK